MNTNNENRPLGLILFASVFVLMGGFLFLAAVGVIPAPPESFEAPRWVVAVGGAMFMWAGLVVAFQGLKVTPFGETRLYALLHDMMGLSLLLLLAIIFNWVTFAPGERHFTGGISVPFITFGSYPSETSGRVVFGCAAAGMDILLVWGILWRLYRFWKDGL